MYNFNHLYYFYMTAKHGGVTAAAKHLGLSQPSLSGQLKVLESSLALKLFKRVGRKNQLTQMGRVVFGFCQQMFELAESMNEVLTQQQIPSTRHIQLGVTQEVEESLLVQMLKDYSKSSERKKRPKISLLTGSRESLLQQLRFQEIDLLYSEEACEETELLNLSSVQIPVVLVCPRSWSKHIPKGLEAFDWVMPALPLKLRYEIDRFFEDQQIIPKISFESNHLSALVRAVDQGLGVSFLPLSSLTFYQRELAIEVFEPPQGYWQHQYWVSVHKLHQEDPLLKSLALAFMHDQ